MSIFYINVPKKAKEEFLQEQLYIEDCYDLNRMIDEKDKKDVIEDVERGVVVIDLL
jgi:hypothetical protein